ncbi:uncharacterized protein si:dkey-154b15.1 [Xyrauchen texanus]|uniref:uncharacterized protein si:dkey-154b15.1 n=1 Tax=Xyrauchen texanus TaxID=154827 RepID=UPI0022422B81|nr:uncharacterized protein si:dkey-154b15.1 [Xyrauchen texanus]
MDTVGMVIEVSGLPDIEPNNSMIDRITMHFLKRSNMGADVLTVIYPTSTKGQAYVVFESAEVPGVLEHSHLLEAESRFYPLEVKRVHQPQLDMSAEAFLDANLFSSQREILNLLDNYGFKVSETRSGQLHLQGSFLKLKLIRSKLMQLLAQETHLQRTTPSPYTNGYSKGSESKYCPNDYESIPKSTSRYNHTNGNSVYVGASSPSTVITSRSPESPSFRTVSPLAGSSSSEGSFSSPSRLYEDSNTSWKTPSPRQTEVSFPVEPDVFKYTMRFEKEFINKIELEYSTRINVEEDSGVFTVKILGGAFDEAAKKLSYFMQDITSSLRTQQIDLNKLNDSQQRLITHNIYMFQDIYKVLIWQDGHVIKVVGSSKESYEVKQRLLGGEVDNPVPSQLVRNAHLRRSNSLPRQTTRTRMEDDRPNPDIVLQATTFSSSSPSHYPRDSQSGRDLQQDRGRQPSKPTAERGRRRSTSESRHKNKKTVDRSLPNDDQQDLITPSGVKTFKQKPVPKFLSFFQNPGDIKSKLRKNQKSQISSV